MIHEPEEEREPGQKPLVHEPVEPLAEPKVQDTNELADERVEVLEPDEQPSSDPE